MLVTMFTIMWLVMDGFIGVNSIEWVVRGDAYYHFVEEKLTQPEARQACLRINADLTSILTRDELVYITTHPHGSRQTHYWIGLSTNHPCNDCGVRNTTHECAQCRNGWRWLNGDIYDFQAWQNDDPDGIVSCAVLYLYRAEYMDTSCSSKRPYICKVKGICEESPCIHGDCHGSQTPNDYSCTCAPGYQGTNCSRDINECDSSPCLNHGDCKDLQNDYKCNCPHGWTGVHCETDINECVSRPCLNNGDCADLENGFKCNCSHGWTGNHCETEIGECASNPCLNNGDCENMTNGFSCHCQPGWTSTNCDIEIDECVSSPCLNNGDCEDLENGFKCDCPHGWTGEHCETEVDECASNPCLNSGDCEDLVNGYSCHCNADWTSVHCEIEIKDCESSPCVNNGDCEDMEKGYKCNCPHGWTGVHCETDINECESSPCLHNGDCEDLENGYKCKCLHGWTGEHCETEVDECESSPCLNNGACEDLIGDYMCTCPAGVIGVRCQIDINECESSPCLNSAQCEDFINGYKCHCLFGWIGVHCQMDLDECSSYLKEDLCVHGACVNTKGAYICICSEGYSGNQCNLEDNDKQTSGLLTSVIILSIVVGNGLVLLVAYCAYLALRKRNGPETGGVGRSSASYQDELSSKFKAVALDAIVPESESETGYEPMRVYENIV